jgi:hypothetical protein
MRLSTLGLISVIAGAISVAPAFAGTPASISGSATLVTPAGFTSTVSGESILPSGFVFLTDAAAITAATQTLPFPSPNAELSNAAVIVVPTFVIAGATFITNTLSVGSAVAVTQQAGGSSFSATAANLLNLAGTTVADATPSTATAVLNNIEFVTAIIRAGAGINGLD